MREFTAGELKFGLLVIVLFCVSIVMSCREVSYWIWGQSVDATVTQRGIVKVPSQRLEDKERFRIDYRFVDSAGLKRIGYLSYEPDDPAIPTASTLRIEYLAEQHGPSRLAGKREWIWPALMLAIPVFVVVASIVYVQQQTAPSRPGARGRAGQDAFH